MGNQQPKEKSVLSEHKICDTDFFSSTDEIDLSDSWHHALTSKVESNNLSSFTVSDPKDRFVIAQSDFNATRSQSHISVQKGEKLKFKGFSPDKLWANVIRVDGSDNGWIPLSIIGEVTEDGESSDLHLQHFSWYHGSVPRNFAEYLLNSGINGSFLVRESESDPRLRSISLRFEGKIWHFRISKDGNNKFYVVENQRFSSIQKLVEYHSKYADSLPCTLLYAAPKRAKATVFGVIENDLTDNWEIDRTEILMKDQLGVGQYGIVYEAFWQRHNITVAVKTVKADIMVADDFLEEARLMKSLQHPNLVRLLGVCTKEPPNYIVTEFMDNGNLLDYLRTKPKHELSPPVLLYMAIQISAGMAYLEEHNFIHRDLAARNCLVGQDNIVKVADFGLARCMERDDTYTAHIGAKFPIKWTAPEGLAFNVFSTKSDVWAFGVLLWELATYGMTPYPGTELQDVYVYLQNNNIMSRPSGCPENVYHLMKQCWQWQPEKRPTFKAMHGALDTMLSNINEQVNLEVTKEKMDSLPTSIHKVVNGPKRKEAPMPPMRTTTLKEMSMTGSFTMSSRHTPCLMDQSLSDSFITTPSEDDDDNDDHDDLLPLPPPEEHLITVSSNLWNLPPSRSPFYDPPPPRSTLSNPPQPRSTLCNPPQPRSTLYNPPPPRSTLCNPPPMKVVDSSSKSLFEKCLLMTPGERVSNFLSVTKGGPWNQQARALDNNSNESVRKVQSEKVVEKDFQSELKSRLKTHLNETRKMTGGTGGKMWPVRNSMGHIMDQDSVSNTTTLDNNNGKGSIRIPCHKRMSWTEPPTMTGTKKSTSNMFQINGGHQEKEEDEEDDTDDFITKDLLLQEFGSINQELANLRFKRADQSAETVSSIVDKLQTVHLGSTRFCNSRIRSAKIKFKLIEQCSNLAREIETLRRCLLKPYDHNSALATSTSIRASLGDLGTVIENTP